MFDINTDRDSYFMSIALAEAEKSAQEGEVPVGAVIVRGNEVISLGRNMRETQKTALSHAELHAIHAACLKLGGWRLHECEIFVTLEPCPMCMGAAINARLLRVVFGASDPKNGACGSVIDLNEAGFTFKTVVQSGVLGGECSSILTNFFVDLRNKRNNLSKIP
ncbi:MAG: nucleoside deaminase [Oscillospiraceae bacterium]|nr:nucleoside deaminase [Oscillospiraceae bacterium]